jgi:hypothetical protein
MSSHFHDISELGEDWAKSESKKEKRNKSGRFDGIISFKNIVKRRKQP